MFIQELNVYMHLKMKMMDWWKDKWMDIHCTSEQIDGWTDR